MTFPDFFNQDGGEFAQAIREGLPFKEIVRDNDELYLRVASVFQVGPEKLTVVTGEPLDKDLIADIAANLGEITLYAAGVTFNDAQQNDSQPNGPQQSDQNRSAAQGHSFETRLFQSPRRVRAEAMRTNQRPLPVRKSINKFSVRRSLWVRWPHRRTSWIGRSRSARLFRL